MIHTYITRNDAGVGVGLFDSIKWAFEHFGQKDDSRFNYGVMIGWNESEPSKIHLWEKEPNWDTKPDLILEETK